MEKRWVFRDIPNEEHTKSLCEAINVNPVLGSILVQRGITNFDEAKSYFRPEYEDLHDPFLMKDMDLATERLQVAINNSEKILIYGDYDVDGTTSVALVYGTLKELTTNIDLYLPDRYTEGYGISNKGIDYAIEHGVNLIIALDCGIRANEKIKNAGEAGIDVIVCDHHIPGDDLPPAIAILDPKQKGCTYPFKELSGCGIGFKLLQALFRKNDYPDENLLNRLDLVAVSIAADIVPIVDENRILTYLGLKRLNQSPGYGLKALISKAGLGKDIDVSGIVFGIAPRINAAGRIRHANDAVWLLLADTEEKATELSDTVQDQNTRRKTIDKDITDAALGMIEEDPNLKDAKCTVVFNPDWHKGVIGIVASRLIESFYRPTIVLTESGGKATGSARSVEGFNIYEAIRNCSDLLDQFGGHAYAAGLTLPIENIPAFQSKFEETVQSRITDDMLIPKVNIDHLLDLDRINPKFYNVLKQMEPFGPGNPSPLFLSEDVRSTNPRLMKEEHLKMWLRQGESKRSHEAVAFRLGKHFDQVKNNESFNVVYHLETNEFNGEKSIQLVVKDIKFNKNYGLNTKG